MFGIPFISDTELETKLGLNKIDLMIEFLELLETKDTKLKRKFLIFKSWLMEHLKRTITTQEEIALLEGILKYIRSEPMTNERSDAIQFLFEAKFLSKP